jgi:hypothetical protein
MPSSGMLRCLDLVRADVSEKRITFINRLTSIGELGTKLAVTSDRRPLPEPHSLTSQTTVFFKIASVTEALRNGLREQLPGASIAPKAGLKFGVING